MLSPPAEGTEGTRSPLPLLQDGRSWWPDRALLLPRCPRGVDKSNEVRNKKKKPSRRGRGPSSPRAVQLKGGVRAPSQRCGVFTAPSLLGCEGAARPPESCLAAAQPRKHSTH